MQPGQTRGDLNAATLYRSIGACLQLAGVAAVAYGVLKLRAELQPDRSVLVRSRRWRGHAWHTLRRTATKARNRIGQVRRRLWDRLRGRRVVELGGVSTTETARGFSALTVDHQAEVQVGPDWSTLTPDERSEQLHRQLKTLTKRTTRLDRRQRDDHERLARELADTRKQLERLHLGGLIVEAWGAALIAVGIIVNTWADWIAASVNTLARWIAATPVAQAVLLGCAVGAVGWVVTDEDRRWWRA